MLILKKLVKELVCLALLFFLKVYLVNIKFNPLFGMGILSIPSHLLGWKYDGKNGLEWFKNNLEKWFDFANFEVV